MKKTNDFILQILALLKEWPVIFAIIGALFSWYIKVVIDVAALQDAQADSEKDRDEVIQRLEKIDRKTDDILWYIAKEKK